METMKAIVIYEAGGPEKLLLEERPIPELQEGWTLVRSEGLGLTDRRFLLVRVYRLVSLSLGF